MTSASGFYRIVQPSDEKVLCRVNYDAEVVVCPTNKLHQREGVRTSSLRISHFAKKAPRHFCYSWGSECLVSRRVASELAAAGLDGFFTREISPSPHDQKSQFLEFVVEWKGNVVRPGGGTELTSYCRSCGLMEFALNRDPPWTTSDLLSGHDFFILAPINAVFCSERACSILKSLCGDEFLVAPGAHSFSYNVPIGHCSITWPSIDPPLVGLASNTVWDNIRLLDVGKVVEGAEKNEIKGSG